MTNRSTPHKGKQQKIIINRCTPAPLDGLEPYLFDPPYIFGKSKHYRAISCATFIALISSALAARLAGEAGGLLKGECSGEPRRDCRGESGGVGAAGVGVPILSFVATGASME
jgi:hypothetical protein